MKPARQFNVSMHGSAAHSPSAPVADVLQHDTSCLGQRGTFTTAVTGIGASSRCRQGEPRKHAIECVVQAGRLATRVTAHGEEVRAGRDWAAKVSEVAQQFLNARKRSRRSVQDTPLDHCFFALANQFDEGQAVVPRSGRVIKR